MEKTLRIGTAYDIFISSASEKIEVLLSEKGIRCESVFIKSESGKNFQTLFYDAIKENKIDTVPFELSLLPVYTATDEIIVSAISGRITEGEGILLNDTNIRSDQHHPMQPDLKIGVKNERQQKQLENIFPEQKFIILEESLVTNHQICIPEDLDGIIISKSTHVLFFDKIIDCKFIGLHPKELIPAPGQGIVAYLCHREDISTRRVLNLIHQRSWVNISNTERRVLKMAGNEFANSLGVYCQTDPRGYFHVHAVRCDQFKKVSFSQSISDGLPEKIYQSLF